MAAFLPPRNGNDMSYREDNGGGGVGKVRKNTFGRATRTKPYDRPPTSIRNPNTLSSNASGGNNNGWLSKLVDPAQRLITASAHKLFSSVFRKRLPPPPLQPPEPEANERTRDERRQADPTDHVNTHGAAVDGFDISSGSSDRGGITDLEQMFKQKTFTRSEIDRLTALLQSRSIDMSVGHEERRSEVIPSTAVRFQDRKGEFLNTPVKDSRIGTNLISTPIVSEDVLDEDVASPAELAKAYMGSRPSKVSPSMLGLRSQPPRENSSMPMNSSSLKSAIVPAFPRSSGRPGFIENGFLTPRSLSRSAIHSLARASQSRFHSPTTFQGPPGQAIESVGGSTSASQIAWENNRSGSKQGSLKRRSSVLDNDIGSSDGIRRIRQKYNLLPGSGSLPIRRTGLASDATKHPSSIAKTHLEGEPSTVNGGNSFHGSGFTPVPTKSSEMASKIFQQLDALVKTSKEKSPAKLSPSMLRGSALKSLENVDSSMFLDNVPDNNLDVRRDASLSDAMDSAPQKQGLSEENGPPNSIAYNDKPILEVGDKDAKSLVKNSLSNDKTTAMSTVNSALHPPAQKKRAFQMTAHEDFLDLDDDYSNGNENTLAGGSEKLDPALAESKTSGAGSVTVENPPASTEVNPPSGSIWEQKTETLTFSKKPSPIATLAGTENKSTTVSDKDDSPKKSNDGVPISVLEDKLVSRKEPNGISPTFSFGAKMGNEAPQMIISSSSLVADSSRINFSASSDSKPGNSSSISVAFGATESPLTAGPESQKRDSKNNLKADAFRLPETVPSAVSTPSPSIFQFGSSSSLNNGSVTPPFLSAAPPAATDSAKTTSTGNTTANNFSPASSTPSFVAATISSVFPSTSASPPSATAAAVGFTEAKTKETSFGNLTGSSFGGTSSGMGAFGGNHFGASTSAVSNIFGGATGTSSSSASTVSNIFGGTSDPSSTSASTVSNIFGGTSGPSSTSAGTGTNFFGSTSAMTSSGSSLFGTSSAMTTPGSNVFGGTTMSSESNIFGGTGSSNFGGTSSSVASTGSGIFSFNTGTASSAASNQPQAFNPFSNGSAPALTAGSVSATSTQSIPIQFGSSASAPSSGLTGNTAFSSSSPFFGASSSSTKPFNSGATFGLIPSTPSSEASALSSSSNNTSVFGSSWQTLKSPVPNSTTSAPSVFAFGGSSASTTTSNTTPVFFGSSASNSSASFPPFSTPAVATPTQPVFGNSSPAFPFGNNGQMSMEESMAEDTVQTSTPSAPVVSVFNQQPMSSSFVFGASSTPAGGNQFGATPPAANPFQFGGQPNIATPQNASPFQASGSLEFNAGGSFSLGASGGGGDKSNRRIVKVRRAPRKK